MMQADTTPSLHGKINICIMETARMTAISYSPLTGISCTEVNLTTEVTSCTLGTDEICITVAQTIEATSSRPGMGDMCTLDAVRTEVISLPLSAMVKYTEELQHTEAISDIVITDTSR